MATPKEMNRTSGVARRKATNASYNNSPFKGLDPLSQIASFAWRLPGAIASGRTLSGRKVTGEEVTGLAAMAALGAAGIYAGTRGARTAPRTPGARPMTTAERSVAVTKAGRNGVGYIGQSIKPYSYGDDIDSRYNQVYRKANAILDNRAYDRADSILATRRKSVDKLIALPYNKNKLVNASRYKGFTQEVVIEDDFWDPNAPTYTMIPKYMKSTLDSRAEQKPLRTTAKVTRKVVRKGK